jgi:nucleoside-diphosphate-sugar epimerase
MRLLVTGATGFIGSHFLECALRRGYDVVAQKRSDKSRPRIPLAKEPTWLVKPLDEIEAEDIEGVDVLVHLAAHSANVPYDTLENCLYWNLTAAVRLVQIAHLKGIRRFVVAGSCFEYGCSGERYEFIPTHAPLEPTQSYPTSKAAASIALIGFAAEAKVQLSIHRIFQVFGPGEPATRLWPSIQSMALSGKDMPMTAGEQIRDFIPVEIVAEQLLKACHDYSVIPGIAKLENVGTGKPQTVRAFAEYWWRHWNAQGKLVFGEIPYRAGEVMRYVPEIVPQ